MGLARKVLYWFRMRFGIAEPPISAAGSEPGCTRSVNHTHTSTSIVLLFCDTVNQRNVSKLNRFQSWCKTMSVNKPVSKNQGGWGFTPWAVPTIPPPSVFADTREL